MYLNRGSSQHTETYSPPIVYFSLYIREGIFTQLPSHKENDGVCVFLEGTKYHLSGLQIIETLKAGLKHKCKEPVLLLLPPDKHAGNEGMLKVYYVEHKQAGCNDKNHVCDVAWGIPYEKPDMVKVPVKEKVLVWKPEETTPPPAVKPVTTADSTLGPASPATK
ncbi:uncharacterized protein BDZ99DRAFT_522287 [Mytilinidion resinicola]|uniref:Uncharacterized protein n=1 Tax=Mytilinidion resinicola TaxID=574789 RepID=A0A6A6YI55_9PEZI|nr:uncharacterized protein BDZ99DRAFT_522287 [Mytilinidion resinicola]KAF2807665.1 hypothetical protein BDZ99DRAFT_522287 [Mytilinidion resinicola]